MSVFGGDSWGREANYRKRRLDDFVIQDISNTSSSSSYKKLANGKYACLVCPQNPVLDTPLMLSMHMKGSRHCAAESRLKERELSRQCEINKRIALSGNNIPVGRTRQYDFASKPLTQRTMKAVSEALGATSAQPSLPTTNNVEYTWNRITNASSSTYDTNNIVEIVADKQALQQFEYKEQVPPQQQLDYKERQQKELKFKAAGWKRDGFGGWYKDDNVEFDSDEEDPNVCFAEEVSFLNMSRSSVS